MNKSLLALPLLLCLCGFTDPAGTYSIDFPKDWGEPFASGNAFQAQSPGDSNAHRGWCRVNSNALDSLKDAKQADLNAEFAKPITLDVWSGMLSLDQAKLALADSEAKVVEGTIVQGVTLTLAPGLAGEGEVKARINSWILPGRVLNAACFANSEDFADFEPQFREIVASVRPR
jgi:hypothetical protein